MMLSGGLPHSEIPGSKLILSSPGLIAEYHVLHRLLLPRHPPNALLALDLIQKEQDSHLAAPGWFGQRLSFRSEVVHFSRMLPKKHTVWLVYLTWTKLPFQGRLKVQRQIRTGNHVVAQRSSPTGAIGNSDVFSLYDVKSGELAEASSPSARKRLQLAAIACGTRLDCRALRRSARRSNRQVLATCPLSASLLTQIRLPLVSAW